MVQVNLLSKRKGVRKQRNIFLVIGLAFFVCLSLYFMFQVVSVVYRYVSVNSKLKNVRKETAELSTQMLRDNDSLNRFILTKLILSEIVSLRSKQFDYTGYLDQVQSMITSGSEISGVDFNTKNFVNLSVTSNDTSSFSQLEKSLKSIDSKETDFNSAVFRSVSRAETGAYRTDLLFGIKKNNGK